MKKFTRCPRAVSAPTRAQPRQRQRGDYSQSSARGRPRRARRSPRRLPPGRDDQPRVLSFLRRLPAAARLRRAGTGWSSSAYPTSPTMCCVSRSPCECASRRRFLPLLAPSASSPRDRCDPVFDGDASARFPKTGVGTRNPSPTSPSARLPRLARGGYAQHARRDVVDHVRGELRAIRGARADAGAAGARAARRRARGVDADGEAVGAARRRIDAPPSAFRARHRAPVRASGASWASWASSAAFSAFARANDAGRRARARVGAGVGAGGARRSGTCGDSSPSAETPGAPPRSRARGRASYRCAAPRWRCDRADAASPVGGGVVVDLRRRAEGRAFGVFDAAPLLGEPEPPGASVSSAAFRRAAARTPPRPRASPAATQRVQPLTVTTWIPQLIAAVYFGPPRRAR